MGLSRNYFQQGRILTMKVYLISGLFVAILGVSSQDIPLPPVEPIDLTLQVPEPRTDLAPISELDRACHNDRLLKLNYKIDNDWRWVSGGYGMKIQVKQADETCTFYIGEKDSGD